MASTKFQINKTSASGNSNLKITTKAANNTTANNNATVRITKGGIVKTVAVSQMYKPVIKWSGSTTVPTVSRLGGTLTMTVQSPYPFWIYQCPDSVSSVYVGQQFAAGTHSIEVRVQQATATTETTNTIQIAFDRCDGRRSYVAEPDAFKVQFKQEAATTRSLSITPTTLTASASGGTYSAVLRLQGRVANENVNVDYNESDEYVTMESFTWRSSSSEYADIVFSFDANTGSSSRQTYYTFETLTDSLSATIGMEQEAQSQTAELAVIGFETADGNQYSINNPQVPKTAGTYVIMLRNTDAVMDVQADSTAITIQSYTTESTEIRFNLSANNGFSNRDLTITIYGNQVDSISFSFVQLKEERSFALTPSTLTASASGGTYTASLTLYGRYTNEQITTSEVGDYFTLTSLVWAGANVNTATVTISVLENTSTEGREDGYVMFDAGDVTYKLYIDQQAAAPTTYPVQYDITNASLSAQPAEVDIDGTFDVFVTANNGYQLTASSFTVIMDGADVTDDVVEQSGIAWRIYIEDVYGPLSIIVAASVIPQYVNIEYDLDGVALTYQPTTLPKGGTLSTVISALSGYLPDPTIEVRDEDYGIVMYQYDYHPDTGLTDLTIENIQKDIHIGIYAAAVAQVNGVGMRFSEGGWLEFYVDESAEEEIRIDITIDDVVNTYYLEEGTRTVNETVDHMMYSDMDFAEEGMYSQIGGCEVVDSENYGMKQSMSEDFISRMDEIGNTSYANIVWAAE